MQKYKELSAMAMEDRKQSFSNLPAEDKSELFKTHLSIQLKNRTKLNKQQKDLISEAISLVDSGLYKTAKDTKEWQREHEKLESFRKKALTIFSKDEASAIFATLGDKSSSNQARSRPDCECSRSSDWCSSQCGNGSNCTSSVEGCGTFWVYTCNGMCIQ